MMPTAAELSLMAAIHADPLYKVTDPQERALLSGLYRRKLVTDVFTAPGRKLTPEGLHLLLSAQEAAKQKADEQAQQAEKDASDRAQVLSDKKKDYRHDFAVAAFGSAFTLFIEHVGDIIDFIEISVEKILTLLGLIH